MNRPAAGQGQSPGRGESTGSGGSLVQGQSAGRGESLVQGIAVLSVAGFVAKLLGAAYRIPLTRLIGAEGVGIYQLAYPVYVTLLSVARAGIPVAISKLVAEYHAVGKDSHARRVFWVSFWLLASSGLIFTLALGLGAGVVARWLGDPRAALALTAVAPAILLVAAGSAFRGYFQGLRRMTPTAVADVVEQFARVAVILVLAWVLFPRGVEVAAAGAAGGAVAGSMISLAYVAGLYVRGGNRLLAPGAAPRGEDVPLARRVLSLGIPVAAASLALPLMGFLDAVIVQNRLRVAGFALREATTLYGRLTGLAMTLVNLPAVLATAIAANMVPWLSQAHATGDRRELARRASLGVRACNLFSVPAAVGLLALATPITSLLYADPAAGVVLAWVSPAVVFLNLYLVTTSILQGMGMPVLPIYHIAAGGLAKIVTSYTLTAIPAWNVRGAALGSVLAYLVAGFLNLRAVMRRTGLHPDWRGWLVIPTVGSLVMTPVALLVDGYWPWGRHVGTLVAITLAALVYGLVVLLAGGVRKEEIASLPGGTRLLGVAGRLRLPIR
ncbi:MAG: polysaccharide biosynthesis protein [Bacillota bacterium]|nr:polysaccharide biosynthesis protein [Bacillota bacterium]